MTTEELIAAIEDAGGIDPLLADLSAGFEQSQQLGFDGYGGMTSNQGPFTPTRRPPPPQPQYAAPVPNVGSMDPTMAASSANAAALSTVTNSLQNISGLLRETIQVIRNDATRVNTNIDSLTQMVKNTQNAQMSSGGIPANDLSIKGMVQLQQQAQAMIAASQISMPQAQALNPEMYSNAPGLAYQTHARAAVFRNQVPFSPLIGQSSLSSYRPEFTRDRFNEQFRQIRIENEENSYQAASLGEMGSSFGGSIIGSVALQKGVQSMAAKALARLGLGSMGGPLGTAAAVLDMGLDVFGLPSITGTASKLGSAAWNATGGQYFAARDMATDIRTATQFYTGPDADLTGRGYGKGMSARIAGGLINMSEKDSLLDRKDYMNVFLTSAQEGLLNETGTEEQILKKVRGVSKNLRLFMRLSGDPDYKNAIKQMGDLHRMGVETEDLGSAARNITNFASMAGINPDQARVFGQQGAMINQQLGGNMSVGYQTGLMSRALARTMAQSGAVSKAVLNGMGGEEGAAQTLTEGLGAFMAGPGKLLSAGLLRDEGGKAVVDQEMMDRVKSGDFSFEELKNRASAFTRTKAFIDYQNNPEITNQLSKDMGQSGLINMSLSTVEKIMNTKGYDAATSMKVLFGDKSYAMTKMLDPENLRSFVKADQLRRQKQQYNIDKDLEEEDSFYNYYMRKATGAISDFASPLMRRLAKNQEDEAYQEAIDAGMLVDSPEAKLFKNIDTKFVVQQVENDRDAALMGAMRKERIRKGINAREYEAKDDQFGIIGQFIYTPKDNKFLGATEEIYKNVVNSQSEVDKRKIESALSLNPVELQDFMKSNGGRITEDVELPFFNVNVFDGTVTDIRDYFESTVANKIPGYADMNDDQKRSMFKKYYDNTVVALGNSNRPEYQEFGKKLSAQKNIIATKEAAIRKEGIRDYRNRVLREFNRDYNIDYSNPDELQRGIGRVSKAMAQASEYFTKNKMFDPNASEEERASFIRDLFGSYSPENYNIDSVTGAPLASSGSIPGSATQNIISSLKKMGATDKGASNLKDMWSEFGVKEGDFTGLASKLGENVYALTGLEGSDANLARSSKKGLSNLVLDLKAINKVEEETNTAGSSKSDLEGTMAIADRLFASADIEKKALASGDSTQKIMATTLSSINDGINRLVQYAEKDAKSFFSFFSSSSDKGGVKNKDDVNSVALMSKPTTTKAGRIISEMAARV